MTEKTAALHPWVLAPADPETVDRLARAMGLSHTVARILVARGIATPAEAERFLEPDLAREWHDPALIPGMPEAADAVADAVRAGRRIVVFGDFDLDGISSAAVATRGLRALGADVAAIVPHRFREGYGLSPAAIERMSALGPELVVTVDCGISSAEEAEALRAAGIDLVVTDHHEPGAGVPMGVPVADPKLDPACPSADLAGAGVALKLIDAVGARLGAPDTWRDLTDLATLGTVADIVSLRGENRALVADGVRRIQRDARLAIAALCAVAGSSPESLTADAIAYVLAPRLNAAGRMADPALALELLLTDDPGRAEELALALDEHNRLRQATEADLAQAALAQAERVYSDGDRALVLAGEGWHEGVKGIVASRIASRYGVPTLVFGIEDGVARGSGRSAGTVDLYKAVSSADSVITRFGGHAHAVGVTLEAEALPRFRELVLDALKELPEDAFHLRLAVDAEIDLADVGVGLGVELSRLAPFGHDNRKPLLQACGVFMNARQRVGRDATHLRFTAYDGAVSVPAIAFRCPDIEVLAGHEAAVDLAFELDVDEWRGSKRAQLVVREVHQRPLEADAPAAALVEDLFMRADEILAREEYRGIEDAPEFHTKLVGVTFEGRQDVLSRLVAGTPLRLERQPENEHDPYACALFDAQGDHVGFFNRRLAAVLAPAIDAGVAYDVAVTEVTGGDGDRSLGVNVLVSRRDALADAQASAALRAERKAELSALTPAELDAQLVRTFIGDRSLHEAQVRALARLAAGENTLAVMATGRGKSLIFHLHAARQALTHGAASVFVFPLRALVADQAFHLEEAFADVGLCVSTVTGETSVGGRDEAFASLADGGLDVILTTPEFLDYHAARFAQAGRVGFVVIDEAHHVGQAKAGHRPAYARLDAALETLGRPVVLAVTATASDETATAIRDALSITSVVLDPTVRENLRVEDRRDAPDKDGYLASLAARGEKAIIYVNSREQSVRLARMLRKRVPELALRTAFYNGGLSRSARHAVEAAFRASELSVVVSTSAFGEGVNIPDVRHVVLYHLPFNDVEFNQMCGRSGRDGAVARVHLLFGGKDGKINDLILSSLAPVRDDMAALWVTLRDLQQAEGPGFEVTNAELAERARVRRKQFALDERGVSSALGILRELGLVEGEGHGQYRRLSLVPTPDGGKVVLEESVRYAEGLESIAEFGAFRSWVLSAEPDELLARFNRPILPTNV